MKPTIDELPKYINALRKCAKEHENDKTSTGHIIVSDLCRDTANLLEDLGQEPRKDGVILTHEEYNELISNEYNAGYRKGYDNGYCKGHAVASEEQEPSFDKIRADLIQSIQNGTLKIESGNEELFRIIDKYKKGSKDK